MKRKLYSLLSVIFVLSFKLVGQSVIIDPSAGAGSNIIQANSANKALKLPSVAGTSNIGSPQAGQMIYNQSTASPNYYNGTGWQNLGGAPVPSNIFPNSKHFGDPVSPRFDGTNDQTDDYIWVCPAGITKVWIESWTGGGGGKKYPSSPNPVVLTAISGGQSGSFCSFIYTTVPGTSYTIKVSKGTINDYYAGLSEIFSSSDYFEMYNYYFFQPGSNAQVLSFIEGNKGRNCNFDFRTYYAGGVPQNLVMYSEAHGGNAPLGGRGGEGVRAQSGFNNNIIVTSNAYESFGEFPGGGGGAAYNIGNSYGANGLIILHW